MASLKPQVAGRRPIELPDEFGFLDSWFEADTEVERLLDGTATTRANRIARVRDELLPRRAAKWVDRLAWTALTLRHAEEDEPWEAFYLSARELRAGRPIAEIPLMMHVAVQTVDAHAASHRHAGQAKKAPTTKAR